MTWSGSRRRAISGLSGNGSLRLSARGRRSAHGVVLCFGVMDDHSRRRLLGHKLEGLGELHAKRFLRGQKLEHRCVVIKVRTRAIPPRIALATRCTEFLLDASMRPLRHGFG